MINRGKNSVQVILGLFNDTAMVVKNSVPTTSIPGIRIQTYMKPSVSAFNLFDVSRLFIAMLCFSDKRDSQYFLNHPHISCLVWPDPVVSPTPGHPI